MLEDVVRKGELLDIYGPLLTDKQRRCMSLYFDMDLSLSEIGEELGVSRQGAYDMLRRTSKVLEDYEEKLHLLHRLKEMRRHLDTAGAILKEDMPGANKKALEIIEHIEF